ncbi:unnamed protein product [Auanema sp. JU1783]|nr:unnamed protein product [Auanema sp. JU1783]
MDPVEAGPWLVGRPQQLIFLTGLDPANKKSHAALVNCFSSSKDKPPLNLRLVSGELEFPAKPDKVVTKGVLRRDWPTKYLERVPALIVLFLDLDWDHPSWEEKKTEAESKCESIRASCRKDSQLAVVLIQERNILNVEEPLACDRATELCNKCNLSPKHLFVIPILGDIQGYSSKLQTTFHELAQGYYQQKLRTIRARVVPPHLSFNVRQLFKLAFLSELRQDTHTALRNYRLAYEKCKDQVESWDGVDIFEWRSVVGLLNYKMCELSFLHNTAVEAISQMRKHQATFFDIKPGNYPTAPLASIEHQLWKAKQCWHFAQLFESAVQNGLTAVATLNPGTHLDMAASIYSLANKEIAILKAAQPIPGPYPTPDPLANETVYFGQRPWRVGLSGVATADIELNAVKAIILRLVVNYEGVISLLNAAMHQFKRYGCARMQKKVMNEMADVYYASGDCAKALQLWSLIVRDHIPPTVRSVILVKAAWAAYSIASFKDFIWAALQLGKTEGSIVNSLGSVLAGQLPALPFNNANLTEDQVNAYKNAWTKTLSEPQYFTLQVSRIEIHLDVKVYFLCDASVPPKSKVPVYVVLSSDSLFKFDFSSVKIVFDASGKKKTDVSLMAQRKNLVIEPKSSASFVQILDLSNCNFTENDVIMVNNVTFEIGQKNSNMFGQLEMDGTIMARRMKTSPTQYGNASFTISSGTGGLVPMGSTSVDCLVGEVAECILQLQNTTSGTATDIKLEFKRTEQNSTASAAVLFMDSANELQSDQTIQCQPTLNSNETMNVPLRFSAQLVGEMELTIELSYLPENGTNRITSKIKVSVKANDPFFATSGILTMNGLPVTSLLNYSEHLLKVDVTANADITIMNIEWLLADVITSITTNENEKRLEENLARNDMINYCHAVMVNVSGDDREVPLGRIAIEWRRQNSSFSVRSVVALCRLPVLPCPVYITANVLDSPAVVHQPIRVQYTIGNRMEETVELTATFDLSDTYMFCGDKRVTFRLLPGATRILNVVVMALSADRLPFPRIALRSITVPDQTLQHTLRTLPATLFVLPSSKQTAEIQQS